MSDPINEDNTILQTGLGSSIPVYYGSRYQRGMGMGSMFKSFYRYVTPILKTHGIPIIKDAAKFVGTEAIKTAVNLAGDAIEGKDFNTSVKDRAKEVLKNVSEQNGGTKKVYKKTKAVIKNNNSKITKKKVKHFSAEDFIENEYFT